MSESQNRDMNETPTPRSRPVGRLIVLAVVLLLAGAGSYLYWQHAAVRETTDDAQVEARIHSVSARVGGTLTKVLVENNQLVEAGTVLCEIDSRDYQVALDRAKADLAEAQARLGGDTVDVPITTTTTASRLTGAEAAIGEVQAAVAASEKQVAAAQARKASAEALVRGAKANSERAAADLERMKKLLAKDEISRQQYDATWAAAESARAQLDVTQAQVVEAEQGIVVARSLLERERSRMPRTEAEVNAAKAGPHQVQASRARAASTAARVEQAKAAVALAELNLERTVVRAPVRGVVGQKNMELGQVIQAGQPLLALVADDEVWVVANYKENQLVRMKPGQMVEVEVDALGGRRLNGRIRSIGGATSARFSLLPAENSTGNYVKVVQRVPVKIVFDKEQDSGHALRPGLSVVTTVLVQ